MPFIHEFFTLNREIVFFGYGLVFFVLGLAIALQSRNSSRLDLARSLKWLAAFGFAHGLHEWGDLFIPIQANYLSPGAVQILQGLHLFLLALSFAFLFQYAVLLLRPQGRNRWLNSVHGPLLATWFLIAFFLLRAGVPDTTTWYNLSNALARYFIGFPAGMLAAYALRKHTYERILPLNVPHIIRMLRFSGVMMALYAVLSGLIPPPIPVFPGNIVNTDTFELALGIPVPVFRSLVGLGLTLATIRALEVFDLETDRMIEVMEQQQILSDERNRLARDLHDGAIQKVYTAGLLVESARKLAQSKDARAVGENTGKSPDPLTGQPLSDLSGRLEKAETVLNDAIGDLRHNLVELSGDRTEEPLLASLQRLTGDPRFRSLVDIDVDLDLLPDEALSPVRMEHVLAIVNEALSNAVRHARANRVWVRARHDLDRLKLSVEDNGVGLSGSAGPGYGLRNMRDRARLLGGQVDLTSSNGRGTRVELDIPWREER